jgi:glycosyltransferase involved in cell wall biosynthesis
MSSHFGRLSEEKGLFDLLLGMKELPTIPLRIAGAGPLRSKLEDLAREQGLTNVSFVGHQPASALKQLIAESKFTVFPSHAYETLAVHVLFQPCDIVHYHALGPALFSFLPRLGERAAVRFPDSTMVVSRTLKSHFGEHYRASTEYVPNGGPLREPCAGLLQDWGLEPGKYVLFLGRFSPEKNCHLLVEAFEQITTSAKLVLAGGSNTSDAYSRELWRHAGDHVVLLDYVSGQQLDALLTNAMLFVLPSDLEGLSLALLEAMGAGICVLASDIPENRELVDGAGFTFKRGNAADLERMLRILIASPELRRDAGFAARDRIRDHYQWPAIAAEIERIYYSMLGWDRAAPCSQPEVAQIA